MNSDFRPFHRKNKGDDALFQGVISFTMCPQLHHVFYY